MSGLERRLPGRLSQPWRRTAMRGPKLAGLGIAFAAVAVLGSVGFTRYQQAADAVDPLANRVYLAIQLFILESGSVTGAVPWELQVARFAAPIVAAYAVVQVLAVVFRDQLELLRLHHVRGHVVVAGLGRKGGLLAQALLRRGDRVVGIEADEGNLEIAAVRALGGLVVVGDARSPDTLRRAGVGRASHLVVLCGDDATSAEIVTVAREQVAGRREGHLQCVVHVADPDLCLLLCIEEFEHHDDEPVRVEFVNLHAAAAQALLHAHPIRRDDAEEPRVVVHGGGPTARHLLLALARAWAAHEPEATPRLEVTSVGLEARALAAMADRHTELARFVELQPAGGIATLVAERTPTLVYVCPDDDSAAAADALVLRRLLAGRPARIVVVFEQRSGLGHLLQAATAPPGGPTMATFGLHDEACQPDVLLTGTTELLARALHRTYVDEHGGPAGDEGDPALRPWSELPEALRESNRAQAAHAGAKLAAVGCGIGPLVDWDAAQHPFSDPEIEVMARLEHERWVSEHRTAGWRPGPRDLASRTTPYLVPWDELSDEVRDYDRMFVRRLPQLLAAHGLQVIRRTVPPPAATSGTTPGPFPTEAARLHVPAR
jgi:hypothetical protein